MSKGKFCDNCGKSLSGFVLDELIYGLKGYYVICPLFEKNKHFCNSDCLKEYYSNFDAEEVHKQGYNKGYEQCKEDIVAKTDLTGNSNSMKEDVKIALSWFAGLDTHEIVHRIKEEPEYESTLPQNVINTIVIALYALQDDDNESPYGNEGDGSDI